MTSITVTYQMPEDMHDFNMAHHASLAWAALDEIANLCRSHVKHDAPISIEQIRTLALEALRSIE